MNNEYSTDYKFNMLSNDLFLINLLSTKYPIKYDINTFTTHNKNNNNIKLFNHS